MNKSFWTEGSLRCVVFFCLAAGAMGVARAEDEGAKPLDLTTLIKKAASEGKGEVEIPPGEYRVEETIAVKDVQNLNIRAAGVRIIKTKVGETLEISRCKNVKISGLTIDYDPVPFTQATITGISTDRRQIEFEIHEGYPALTPEMLTTSARHYFDGKTRLWKEGVNVFNRPKLEVLEGRRGRATFDRAQEKIEAGDYVTFDRRRVDKSPCISVRSCPGEVVLEDITIHAAGGLAVVGRHCDEQVVFRRMKIERGPRPPGATQERLLSTDADAMNFAYCRKGPLLEECEFSFMGDDALNVHGIAFPILKVLSPQSVLVSRGSDSDGDFVRNVREGDRVDILRAKTFEREGEARCVALKVLPTAEGITSEQVAAYFEATPKADKAPMVFRLDFAEPVDFLKEGQWIEFPELNCPGFIVRNNYFHDHRARGLRIMGSNGVIEGNRFERIGAAAIQIGPEWQYWREAGWVKNVTVRNNTFKDIGVGGEMARENSYALGVISITARTDEGQPPYPREQTDIVIEGNEITGSPGSGIHAYGVRNLTIRNNVIQGTNREKGVRAGQRFQLSAQYAIELEGAADPIVENNRILP